MHFLKHFTVWLFVLPLAAHTGAGELHLRITDPHGVGAKGAVLLVGKANEHRRTFATNDAGILIAKRLPFGLYRVRFGQPGFAVASAAIEIRSAIPVECSIGLSLSSVTESVDGQAGRGAGRPHRTNSVNEVGAKTLQTRIPPLPGRSLEDWHSMFQRTPRSTEATDWPRRCRQMWRI